jgi:endonuclease/exonuclease/phosphatase family metal-dependent hydrolase
VSGGRFVRWLALVLLSACAHASAARSDQSLRVVTYNIAAGNGNLDGIVSVLRAANADIVALQEVDVHWDARSAFADQAAVLGQQLDMQVRFAPIYHVNADRAPPREYGVALLSRFPIIAFTNQALTRLSTQPNAGPPAPMPGLLDATIDVRGTRVRVFNTHLDYRADPAVRMRQVSEMLTLLKSSAAPTLVFGDLNATPLASELAPLLAHLEDAWRVSSDEGLTYPATAPVKRIDYVLMSPHFRSTAAHVPVTLASDHRPVVVNLLLRPARP